VGNPFNLTSTVTAGIVSAKARNINILGPSAGGSASAIESFIQTDAAVNKGNSGGALVNTRGELVGINAAIASGTGYYAGYSFAIPVNIVRKVVDDLLQFGRVQRAYIGVRITDVTSELSDKEGIDKIEGVYVAGVTEDGAAQKAGIKEGDVIISIEDKQVNSVSQLLGEVGQYRPGDMVDVEVKRNGKYKTYRMTLTDSRGNKTLSEKAPEEEVTLFGASFKEPPRETLQKLNLDNGVQVKSLERNSRLAASGIEEGFIITRIDKKVINTPGDIKEILEGKRGGVLIEGVYPNGTVAYYGFGL
jgi:S1-C subfamily serine protease